MFLHLMVGSITFLPINCDPPPLGVARGLTPARSWIPSQFAEEPLLILADSVWQQSIDEWNRFRSRDEREPIVILADALWQQALGEWNQFRGGYASDPTIRTKRLLYQSEDFRQMGKEWRRFWFNDHRSHMTTERIHGGIID